MLTFVDTITFIGLIEMLILFLYAVRYYIFSVIAAKIRWQPNQENTVPNSENDPYVSVFLPIYNEQNVVNRLLKICTSFNFPDYEVVVIDDSTDESTKIIEKWKDNPRVKVIHRNSREGWKGGALNVGLKYIDPRSTHTLILDADFIPPTNFLQHFLSKFTDDNVVAVQGYQLHDLNADENWVTKGIKMMHSVGNLVELNAKDKLGLLVSITGSAYMVRTDILTKLGFNKSLTEDCDLTLRLYQAGHKVIYDPTLIASAECSDSVIKFLKQQTRWAEGHTRDFRKHFWNIMTSKFINWRKKIDFLFHGCYFLNSILVVALTIGGLLVLPSFQYSLSLTNTISTLVFSAINISSIILSSVTALVRENMLKDFVHIPYLLLLAYLSTPAIAYASLKGLFMGHEYFNRTYKTGAITKLSILNRIKKY